MRSWLIPDLTPPDPQPEPNQLPYHIIYSAKSLGLPWVKNNRLNDDSVSTELDVEDMLP